jgi:DNA-binding CsgD family transcriptional regulator
VVDPCGEDKDVGAVGVSGDHVGNDLLQPGFIGDEGSVDLGHSAWRAGVGLPHIAVAGGMHVQDGGAGASRSVSAEGSWPAAEPSAATLLRRCTDAGIAARLLTAAQRGTGVAVSARRQGDTVAEELTSKEHEVLGLLATRLSRREIGQRLYVSLNTVKTHQRALYRKLGVENRTAAVTRARELGLL